MIKYLQRRYALSRKGAIDNIKGILCCAMQNISFMLPVGLLYRLVSDMMSGTLTTGRIPFYVIGCVAAALFIVVCTRLEYDNTYLVTYVESGVRRVGLAEKLRKIPLSFFGKKDLADLTTSIMNDCAVLEQSQSHFVAPLYGAILSTTVIAVSMLFFNWRMALAAVWPLPARRQSCWKTRTSRDLSRASSPITSRRRKNTSSKSTPRKKRWKARTASSSPAPMCSSIPKRALRTPLTAAMPIWMRARTCCLPLASFCAIIWRCSAY